MTGSTILPARMNQHDIRSHSTPLVLQEGWTELAEGENPSFFLNDDSQQWRVDSASHKDEFVSSALSIAPSNLNKEGWAAVAEVEIAKAVADTRLERTRADNAERRAEQSEQDAIYWRQKYSVAEARLAAAEKMAQDATTRALAAMELAKRAEARAVIAELNSKASKQDMANARREVDSAVARSRKSEKRAESAELRALQAESITRSTETRISLVEKGAAKVEEQARGRVRTAEKLLAAAHDNAQVRIKAAEDLHQYSMDTASIALAECRRQLSEGGGLRRSSSRSKSAIPHVESVSTMCCSTSSIPVLGRSKGQSASPSRRSFPTTKNGVSKTGSDFSVGPRLRLLRKDSTGDSDSTLPGA